MSLPGTGGEDQTAPASRIAAMIQETLTEAGVVGHDASAAHSLDEPELRLRRLDYFGGYFGPHKAVRNVAWPRCTTARLTQRR